MKKGDMSGADYLSEPMTHAGWNTERYPGGCERGEAAFGRVRGPFSPLAPKPQSQRSVDDGPLPREEFLAILAHELRNPLMPIRCALEIIDRAKGDALAVARAYAIAKRQLAQLMRLVDDMLDASSLASGRIVLHKERIDLHGVVKSAVEAVKPLIDTKQHTLELLLPLTPVHLNADETKLTQIVTNLLTNAAKYTPAGGRIRVSALEDTDSGRVLVRVRDTGIGIPAAELHRIFEMFARVENGNVQRSAGLGIGLALSRELATLHGGSLSVNSDGPGLGSEFVLALPIDVRSGTAATAFSLRMSKMGR
jgi:signal transduction histidine kinase